MNKWTSFTVLLALAGCGAVSPPPEAGMAPPATWRHAAAQAGGDPVTAGWWHRFGNEELDRLVEQAAAGSFDIAAAIARVEQARASARIAGAALAPNIAGFADASRQHGLIVNNDQPGGTAFDLGIAASYELDFWGRNRALRDAALANLRASEFDQSTVELTLTADVANAWLQTVALREREQIAVQNLNTAQRILATIQSQLRAGYATPLDAAQQRAEVAAQQRSVALMHQQANDSNAALAILLGVPAARFEISTRSLDAVRAPVIDAGLPSSLLTRRPDVAGAEARLAAAHADVAAARAAMLPTVTLTGSVGTSSDRIQRLFDNPLYSVAAGLIAPIFNAGSLAAGRDLAVAQQEELLAGYRQTIVSAFGDVERALNANAGVDAQSAAQDEELAQARQALELAESRFRAGAETSLVVLNAQRTLYAAEDERVQLHLALLQAAVSLYRSLGGGWRVETADLSSRAAG